MSRALHRGRWQAQHWKYDQSEAWAQQSPLTKADGVSLLADLEAKLSHTERNLRRDAFAEARIHANRVYAVGGVNAQHIRSFTVRGDTYGRRVDFEVRAGKAIV